MSHYILCPHCGESYDLEDSWQKQDHEFASCANSVGGFCDLCGSGIGNMRTANSGQTVHKHQIDCITYLKEQITYLEQYRLEHDTRYCDLEKAVNSLVEGRRAALAESRTLKAIRENGAQDADVSCDG